MNRSVCRLGARFSVLGKTERMVRVDGDVRGFGAADVRSIMTGPWLITGDDQACADHRP